MSLSPAHYLLSGLASGAQGFQRGYGQGTEARQSRARENLQLAVLLRDPDLGGAAYEEMQREDPISRLFGAAVGRKPKDLSKAKSAVRDYIARLAEEDRQKALKLAAEAAAIPGYSPEDIIRMPAQAPAEAAMEAAAMPPPAPPDVSLTPPDTAIPAMPVPSAAPAGAPPLAPGLGVPPPLAAPEALAPPATLPGLPAAPGASPEIGPPSPAPALRASLAPPAIPLDEGLSILAGQKVQSSGLPEIDTTPILSTLKAPDGRIVLPIPGHPGFAAPAATAEQAEIIQRLQRRAGLSMVTMDFSAMSAEEADKRISRLDSLPAAPGAKDVTPRFDWLPDEGRGTERFTELEPGVTTRPVKAPGTRKKGWMAIDRNAQGDEILQYVYEDDETPAPGPDGMPVANRVKRALPRVPRTREKTWVTIDWNAEGDEIRQYVYKDDEMPAPGPGGKPVPNRVLPKSKSKARDPLVQATSDLINLQRIGVILKARFGAMGDLDPGYAEAQEELMRRAGLLEPDDDVAKWIKRNRHRVESQAK